MHFSRNNRSQQQVDDRTDSIWVYVAISLVYFLLIGLVLLIFLLAPKFTPSNMRHPDKDSLVEHAGDGSLRPLLPASGSENIIVTEKSFQSSPKDPVYPIDPRSSSVRGDPLHRNGRRDYENSIFRV